MSRHALLLALLLCVQGCGIKGPLYIETPEQRQKAEERRQRIEAAKNRDTQTGTAQSASRPAAQTPAPATASEAATESEPADAAEFGMTDEAFGPSALP
jgi:predicted small lipoprotein YifL